MGTAERQRVPLLSAPLPRPPLSFRYSPEVLVTAEALPLAPLVPMLAWGEPELFGLAAGQTLPAGLALDPESGVIAGTPTELLAPTAFTVIASNADGQASTTLTIEVFGVAPLSLQYEPGSFEVEFGSGPLCAYPTSAGGPVDGYTVSGIPLPDGLFLDPVLGLLTGSPTALVPPTLFTIRAHNETGESTCSFLIEVGLPAPPADLSYAPPGPYELPVAPIAPLVPSVSGRVDAFFVDPPLPNRILTVSGGVAFPRSGILLPDNPMPILYAPPEQTVFHPWQTINVWLPEGSAPVDGWPCVLANGNSGYFGLPRFAQLDPADPSQSFFTRCIDAGLAIVFAGTVDSGPFNGWFYPPGHPSGRWEDFDEPMPEKDLLNAVQWVRTQASFPIDPERIFLHGVSAGATIAAFVGLGPDLARPSGSPQATASSRVAGVLCFDVLTSFPAYRGEDTTVAHHWESVSQPGSSATDMADADPAILDANSVARVLLHPLCNAATTPVFLAYDSVAGAIDFSNGPDAFPALRGVVGAHVHDLWHGAKLWERLLWLDEGFHELRSEFYVGAGMETTLGSLVAAPTGSFTGLTFESQDLYGAAIAWLEVRAREAIPDPSGLRIHPKSGWIHGTPNEPSPPSGYEIHATNAAGSSTTLIVVGVDGTLGGP